MTERNEKMLLDRSQELFQPDKPVVIAIDDVTMDFNIANEKLNSFKEYFIALAKRQLMFKRFRALDDISFDVQEGDVFGILGTNGSGKSTLLKIISGVLDPTEGKVTINGNIAPLIEMGAGFDFELTGRENVYLNGAMLGYSRDFISEHFEEIVDFSEIGEFIDMPLKNYSSGMVSRLAFSIATVIVPDILIVDEVLSVGDQMFRAKCERRINEIIHDHNTTVLMVSHSSSEIERMCNKAIWIEKGHTRMIGEAKQVSLTYQALGGHKGSKEAEQYLFGLLNEACDDNLDDVKFISGRDDFILNGEINENALKRDNTFDSVIVLDSNHPTLLSMSLFVAAKSDGLFVLSNEGRLAPGASEMLAAMKPSNVFVLGTDRVDQKLLNNVKKYSGDANIEVLTADDYASLSRLIVEHFESEDGHKGSTVAISLNGSGAATATLSNMLYAEEIPILVADPEMDAKQFVEYIVARGYEQAILFHGYEVDPSEMLDALTNRGIQTVSLDDKVTDAASKKAMEWISTVRENFDSAFVVPRVYPNSAFLSTPLSKHRKVLDVLVDHISMDSMQTACEFISRYEGNLKSITLIGPDGSFDQADKILLARAAFCE